MLAEDSHNGRFGTGVPQTVLICTLYMDTRRRGSRPQPGLVSPGQLPLLGPGITDATLFAGFSGRRANRRGLGLRSVGGFVGTAEAGQRGNQHDGGKKPAV